MRRTLLFLVLLLFPLQSGAQPFRYIDEAGNIIFVDRLNQIPPRYRDQVLKPTPVPIYPKGYHTPRPTATPRPTPTKKPPKKDVKNLKNRKERVGSRKNVVVEAPPAQPKVAPVQASPLQVAPVHPQLDGRGLPINPVPPMGSPLPALTPPA